MRAANTPPYHQRCRLTKWVLITSWMVPLFSSEDMRSDLDPDYRTVSGHFNWALATEDISVSGSCVDGAVNCVYTDGVTETRLFFNTMLLQGQRSRSSMSLPHRDFSRYSESFDHIMYCRWWDIQCFCIFTLLWNCSTICRHIVLQIGEPPLRNSVCLRCFYWKQNVPPAVIL